MLTVHKYEIPGAHVFSLSMPEGSEIVLVEAQGDTGMIWAKVDTDRPHVSRRFYVSGTGHPVAKSDFSNHVASFQAPPFVWHLWEIKDVS